MSHPSELMTANMFRVSKTNINTVAVLCPAEWFEMTPEEVNKLAVMIVVKAQEAKHGD